MKRVVAIPIIVLLLFVLGACNNFKSNTISVVELTERENAILSTTANHAFVFDFQTDGSFKEGSAWIEKYEAGNLVGDKISHLNTKVEQSGSIIFTTTTNNQKELTLNIGISSDNGVSAIHGFDPDSKELDKMASIWESMQKQTTLEEGDIVLASMCFSNSGISSFTMDFYEDPENHMDELNRCEVAYLLRAEFIK